MSRRKHANFTKTTRKPSPDLAHRQERSQGGEPTAPRDARALRGRPAAVALSVVPWAQGTKRSTRRASRSAWVSNITTGWESAVSHVGSWIA